MSHLMEFYLDRKAEIMALPPVMRVLGLTATAVVTVLYIGLYIKIIKDIISFISLF